MAALARPRTWRAFVTAELALSPTRLPIAGPAGAERSGGGHVTSCASSRSAWRIRFWEAGKGLRRFPPARALPRPPPMATLLTCRPPGGGDQLERASGPGCLRQGGGGGQPARVIAQACRCPRQALDETVVRETWTNRRLDTSQGRATAGGIRPFCASRNRALGACLREFGAEIMRGHTRAENWRPGAPRGLPHARGALAYAPFSHFFRRLVFAAPARPCRPSRRLSRAWSAMHFLHE